VHHVIGNPHNLAYDIAAAIGVVVALLLRVTVGVAAGLLGLAVSVAAVLVYGYAHPPSWIYPRRHLRAADGGLGPVGATPRSGRRWRRRGGGAGRPPSR